ncbi:MAG: hypothetical protein RMK20_03585 [Verrucomicrobiales bacterium]|nr:hypothetical protein [Verrucomicrobiales bacterium]
MKLHRAARFLAVGLAGFAALNANAQSAAQKPIRPPGFRPLPPGVHALTGGTVVVKPGRALEGATVVLRDGYIEAVGTNVVAPPDARLWDMRGLEYAGFPILATGRDQPARVH